MKPQRYIRVILKHGFETRDRGYFSAGQSVKLLTSEAMILLKHGLVVEPEPRQEINQEQIAENLAKRAAAKSAKAGQLKAQLAEAERVVRESKKPGDQILAGQHVRRLKKIVALATVKAEVARQDAAAAKAGISKLSRSKKVKEE